MLRLFLFFGKWICFRHEKKRINMFEKKYINFRLLPMAKRFGSRFKSADTRIGFPERKKKIIKQLACQVLFLPLITRKSFCFDFPISYFPEHACPPVTRYKIGGTTREIGVSGVVNFETISS